MGINANRLEEDNEQLFRKVKKLSRKRSAERHNANAPKTTSIERNTLKDSSPKKHNS